MLSKAVYTNALPVILCMEVIIQVVKHITGALHSFLYLNHLYCLHTMLVFAYIKSFLMLCSQKLICIHITFQ
jgi:hypothetical protein